MSDVNFSKDFYEKIKVLYTDYDNAIKRYETAICEFKKFYGDKEYKIFSAPGRTEIIGNHTDHQRGLAMAGSVNLDAVGVAAKNDKNVITVISYGYENKDIVNIDDLTVKNNEKGCSVSLVKGIVKKFSDLGYNIGGLDIYVTSNVLKGSGLSSSAAFEVLIATIINHMYCDGKETPVSIAKIARYAENVYFGKPSGILDQLASSVGGFIYIDFLDEENPIVEKIDFNYKKKGYTLCIVDTGGNHADLTDDYKHISDDLKKISSYFKKEVLREVDENVFYSNLKNLREEVNDRAILRAFHVFEENKRVLNARDCLKNDDFNSFLKILKESGNSSYKYLQNVFSTLDVNKQGIGLALFLTETFLDGKGSYRVHGGGFAGTIQAFVPNDMLCEYVEKMESIFGKGNCHKLFIRPYGAIKII